MSKPQLEQLEYFSLSTRLVLYSICVIFSISKTNDKLY